MLTKTLAVMSLLAPTGGHALGIGEIRLHSALNQNLDAEISLTLSGESVSDIKVSLAAPEKFEAAGVSWSYFLSKIKFETIAQSSTAAVIKITSREALKEPFLDFLLEVSWPKGNLYREFTVLVDPPSEYSHVTPSVAASTPSYAQPSAVAPRHQASRHQQSEGKYGPTLPQDTLWRVAEGARIGSNVSVEQMMLAIYEANPDAFYQENVYALTAGKMLKIPDRAAIVKLSRSQASAEFKRHSQAWRSRSSIARAESEKPRDKQLKLVAPVDATVAEHAVVEAVDAADKAAAAKDKTTPSAVVAAGGDSGVGTTAPSESVAQNKLVELEKQLAMMQELIALKDQQLAALQGQTQASPLVEQEQATSDEIAVVQVEEQPDPLPEQAVATVEPPVQPIQPVQPAPAPAAQPEADSPIDAYYLMLGGVGGLALMLFGWLWWRKRKVDEETNTESMFASSLLTKTAEDNSQFSAPVIAEESPVNEPGIVGESSFLSEFTPSDFDSFDTDQGEIDPISEADVYLAYGRYQQAEELIRQAIKDQPDRDECKLKLLEVFYANEDKDAFQAYANELAAAGKVDDFGFWEKAAEMGREICPDSVLFSSGDDLFSVDEGISAENDVDSTSGDEDAFSKESAAEGEASFAGLSGEGFEQDAAGSGGYDLDFDLAPSVPEHEAIDDQRNNQAIDFDLSSFSVELSETDEGTNPGIKTDLPLDAAGIESIDFESSLLSKESGQPNPLDSGVIAAAPKPSKSPGVDAQVDNFDLSSFSLEMEGMDQGVIASSTRPANVPGNHAEAVGSRSFSMELDESDQGVIATSTDEDKLSAASVDDIDFSSFSIDAEIKGSGLDDGATSDSLSKGGDQGLEFESYEFSSGDAETKGINEFDFDVLDVGDQELEGVDFSAGGEIDLSDGLDDDFDFDFNFDMPAATGQHDDFGVSDLTDMDELETKLDLAKAYVDMGDAAAAKDIAREVLEKGTDAQKKSAQALLDELN